MSDRDPNEIHRRFSSDEDVDAAIKQAVRDTLARHGRMGQRVVVWLDEHPVWVVPDTPPDTPHDDK